MQERPVRLVVTDDLERSRLTVFFRLLLALPHIVWLALWTVAAIVAAIANWLYALATGRPADSLYRFLAAYIRYAAHVNAYLWLAAGPFPGFVGQPGYPVDVEIDPPAPQRRLVTLFRIFLAIPALLLVSVLAGNGAVQVVELGSGAYDRANTGAGTLVTVMGLLGWFACLARARMPRGFRDGIAYGVRYAAEVSAYLFVLTDRYPDSNPDVAALEPAPAHPVRLEVRDDLARSRLTVFFRLLLALPHLVWLALWTLVAILAVIASWFVTLVRGTPPAGLHRFLSAYVRYTTHVWSFLFLVANPFPGFVGRAGSYPVDLELPGPERQSRWRTGFRLLLAIPAFLVDSALNTAIYVAAVLGWFAALATGRMPRGLRNVGAWSIRYSAQMNAYLYLLTERYPFSGPIGPPSEAAEPE